MTITDFNSILSNTGVTLKPETAGETLGGIITDTEIRQVTDFESGKPEFWDDGKPKQQIVVTVKTGQKTDDGADEEGSIYIKTWGVQRKALLEAIRATGQDANTALAPGNTFRITLAGEEPNKNPRLAATKLYKYEIELRANLTGVLDDTPATPSTGTPTAPAQTPAQQANPGSDPASTARQLIAAGLDDATIATATGLDTSVIAILRAN